MKVTITGMPHFNIALDLDHVDMLVECAGVHYDHKCKVAARSGGFLYGWHNLAEWHRAERGKAAAMNEAEPEPLYVTATWDQLDTASKVLEIASSVYVGPQADRTAKRMRCLALSAAFHRIVEQARQTADAWRVEFDA